MNTIRIMEYTNQNPELEFTLDYSLVILLYKMICSYYKEINIIWRHYSWRSIYKCPRYNIDFRL